MGDPLPENVPGEALTRFREEGWSARPKFNDANNPFRLNWAESLTKDEWNVTGIKLLASRLHQVLAASLAASPELYGSEDIDVETCRKQITQRLSPVKAALNKPDVQRGERQGCSEEANEESGAEEKCRILILINTGRASN